MDILTKTQITQPTVDLTKPMNVLLIEEDSEEAHTLKTLASDNGTNWAVIKWADRLSSGLKNLSEGLFDLILLNPSLPDSEGLESLNKILHETKEVPVIVINSHDDEELAVQAIQAGAQDFLSLDHLDRFHFLRALRHAVERQHILKHLEHSRMLERYLAYHDTLTKLPNRQLFFDRLVQAIAHARRSEASVAVLFLDLDGFKLINDTMGHSAGDLLLISVANRLMSCVRESETASRFGGDEFAVILGGVNREQDAAIVAKRILEAFKLPHMIAEQESYVSPSIGISMYPDDGSDAETLVRNADIAMYLAKQEGGHQYLFYTPSMNRGILEQPVYEKNIEKALEREQFLLYYQPQVCLKTGKIISVEALVRWRHPKYGILLPEQFIPAAEKSGLIVPIGDYVLLQACEQSMKWQDRGYPPVRVAVNLSVHQLQKQTLVKLVNQVLKSTKLKPRYLGFEITENSTIHNGDDTIELLKSLKKKGIELAIDDFGIGYSSLGYLKRLPIQTLKIDRSFILNINRDSEDIAIIKAIIAMAHSLGMQVTAEGVETEEQSEILRSLECDAIQGYYFSKPIPADMMGHFLQEFA
jgi:diguanylate cyclase (GGDEF)-like protein